MLTIKIFRSKNFPPKKIEKICVIQLFFVFCSSIYCTFQRVTGILFRNETFSFKNLQFNNGNDHCLVLQQN